MTRPGGPTTMTVSPTGAGPMTLSAMTFSAMTFSAMTLTAMTLTAMTLTAVTGGGGMGLTALCAGRHRRRSNCGRRGGEAGRGGQSRIDAYGHRGRGGVGAERGQMLGTAPGTAGHAVGAEPDQGDQCHARDDPQNDAVGLPNTVNQ
jgi:hypothetical protein